MSSTSTFASIIDVQKILQLKTYFDEIEETNGDDECRAWLDKVFDAKAELATFVASRRKGGPATEYVGFLKGSFNFSFQFRFGDGGPDAIIRFPKPGHTATALRDEKVTNEATVMEYIRQNTTIPVPRVHSWGLTAESPQQFGPFIIMDHVEGTLLSTVLKQPTESDQEDPILNPDIDSKALDTIYLQIANYIFQLSQLPFSRIGAISKDHDSNTWSVTKRPLTYNMNELATVSGCPDDHFPTTTFDSTSDYLKSVARQHLDHVWAQRNIADDPEIAQARFIARRQLPRLIPKYCIHDTGPFLLFCDDMRPSNMLVHPETLQITAMLDFEFTNAMPAQFTYDPPWWLLISGPEVWLDRGSIEEFLTLYTPRMEQFLRALEQVEGASLSKGTERTGQALSAWMRDSWRDGGFWFNYAARKSFELDAIYWAVLHDGSAGFSHQEDIEEMNKFTQTKMEQLKAYKEECDARFA
ncbi:Protein kinase-like domain protein, partial [Metarhizium majus ARSEF 297]